MSAEGPLRDGNAAGLELIETMHWQPGSGFARIARHMARLRGSAAELGFACDIRKTTDALADAVEGASDAMRVRLALARDGSATITIQPFVPLAADKTWTLRLALTELDSGDTLLRHKTSRRERYVQARAEYPAGEVDEVVLANERGELCEGTITNVFADFGDGVLATPRLDCGLLPGVLRGELLDEGRAREAVYSWTDLASARAVFVGNSLRGLIPARLA